jgi:hypothetical protein
LIEISTYKARIEEFQEEVYKLNQNIRQIKDENVLLINY